MPRLYADEYERKIDAFRRWYKGKRAMNNVSQQALADKIGVTQGAVSAKLTGEGTVISYRDLLIFLEAVDATDDEILRFMRLGGRE